MDRDQGKILMGWREKGWVWVKSVLLGGRAASSGAPHCSAWEQGSPCNSPSGSQATPETEIHLGFSASTHTWEKNNS